MSSSYRSELENWLRSLDVKADTVIDVGGAQLPLPGRTKTWEVRDYVIADLPNPHNGETPQLEIDLNRSLNVTNMTADLVFCLEVFEYVFLPDVALNNIKQLMKPDGEAWVSFPTVYPHHQPIEDDSLRYMLGGIKRLADYVGLEIREVVERRPETDLYEQFYRAERMRPAKGFDHNVTGYIVRFGR